MTTTVPNAESLQFPLFQELPDACQLLVISFVATAPLERIFNQVDFRASQGTLAGTLSLVCHKFYDYCQSDLLWQACLKRVLSLDKAWSDAVARVAPHFVSNPPTGGLVTALLQHFNVSTCKNLYQVILNQHIRVRLPVFMMPMEFDPQDPTYQIHFFEPRYRIMMTELMQGHAQQPGEDGPVFLHIVDVRGPRAKVAALIRVVECAFAPDGRSVAELQLVGSVKMRTCRERPQSMGLFYADGYRCDGLALSGPSPYHWSH